MDEPDSMGRRDGEHAVGTWRRRRPLMALAVVAVAGVSGAVALAVSDGGGGPAVERGAARSSALPPPEPGDRGDNQGTGPSEADGARDIVDAELGEAVELGGLTVTVEETRVEADPRGNELLVVLVTLTNTGVEARDYAFAAFALESAGGGTARARPGRREDALGIGSLDPGESVTGVVSFERRPGVTAVVYEPDLLDEGTTARWAVAG